MQIFLGRAPFGEQLAAQSPVLGDRTHYGESATAILIAHIVQIGCPSVAGACVLQGILCFHRHILGQPLQRGLHAQRLDGVVNHIKICCQCGGMHITRNCRCKLNIEDTNGYKNKFIIIRIAVIELTIKSSNTRNV